MNLHVRRATIADVASAAGVSKATVSRFLNHREKLLSPDIAARVEAAVAQLGYSPSPMAQALSRGRSRLIGLIVADITNPYSVAVLRGAEKACQDAGYLVMLFNLGNEPGREQEAIQALAGYQVDGFILNTLGRGSGVVDAMATQGKPAVLVDRRHVGMHADFVSLDNRAAVQQACEHLLDGGWRELLFVSEPLKGVSTRRERAAAFSACMEAHAKAARGEVFESEEGDDEGLQAALQALHRRAQRRKGVRAAVLAGNAVVTLRVARAVASLGWQFGQELGFVGFDDPEWASLIGPGLSTIAQPTDEIGRTAARCLIERLHGLEGPPRQSLLPGELKVRGSSAAGA
ncbi:LacI family DNA-binding transcriptional regulator [Xenophilus arseniciresistens]|uniref:LacI family DNA-binding transcriptional regulator n=1 Tax=Xenophilus arseniciresistens TaxID=1283306 RepID=A0AAE3N895_9BURK|nr:LacI family DNA-binding transcriptional regulator [Xenophilus arseniciresistens]MDA7416398.1 LacI family DNA-binding transcriptional regulator [Xenophilus arseniciresistens]